MDTTVSLSSTDRWRLLANVVSRPTGSQLLLWIDAVGGYLVCLAEELTIGQANPEAEVEIAVVGDLSRQHARIRRQDDTYVLTPLAPTRIAGRPASGPSLLRDGDELELGRSVILRFRQPHPLSSTARLELVSHHRPEPAADGILLMASTCILGPGSSAHVVCRDWKNPVTLFRGSGPEWGCRYAGQLIVDGKIRPERTQISNRSRVCGEDFCFSLEPLE